MAITQKSIKLLWANAAGLCAFSDCRERLALKEAGEFASHTIGEMAHICGDKVGSNRHDPHHSAEERDGYENLILLCPTHHRMIDRRENERRFQVGMLHGLKLRHEEFIRERLMDEAYPTRQTIAREIAPLLAENHQVWLSFGPVSEIARKNPHSDSAHGAWLSERLITIVPNNRRIGQILHDAAGTLTPADHPVVAAFQLHARSYERWVADEISYEGVIRFPAAFAELIEEATRVSIQ
ncbi:HNH endonuclease [Novosphingobium sp. P6W]|uniref:HNH endonuclease n=1 Tax=Novosphingobium sp. P6W TaxID=1609758 RepID=UPI0005C2B5BA|nr:HNH endonuclease [Novosphingobium sp. P6W]AXB80434.1 HNH endonuclease [Novosphingobium sp. P6W]KIS31296.1 HNH endonuclease family protein [Novosphingobium sp. P6W]